MGRAGLFLTSACLSLTYRPSQLDTRLGLNPKALSCQPALRGPGPPTYPDIEAGHNHLSCGRDDGDVLTYNALLHIHHSPWRDAKRSEGEQLETKGSPSDKE